MPALKSTCFLEIAFVWKVSMHVCVCVCVRPQAMKSHSPEMKLKLTSQTSPKFPYMALAVDITNGHDLSNEVLSKEQQSDAVFFVHFTV